MCLLCVPCVCCVCVCVCCVCCVVVVVVVGALFRGLLDMVDGEKLVPFVRLFYDSPSTHIWEDDIGDVRHVCQGDPLMPLLFIRLWPILANPIWANPFLLC